MRGTMLIVDDELIIRKGLAKLIDSNVTGWVVIGEADNGQEAIRKMTDLQPQLVLTDIRMPLADGLEVAKHAAQRMPETAVVILTGHRDFEYAQAALRYGVRDFLLKPCSEEELCRVLRKAYEAVREKDLSREKETRRNRQQEEQLLRSMLLRLPCEEEALRPVEGRLIGRELWLLRIATYVPESRGYRKQDMKLLQFAVGNIIEEMLNNRTKGHRWFPLEFNEIAFFLEKRETNASMLEETAAKLDELLGLDAVTSFCGVIERFGDAERLYGTKVSGRGEAARPAAGSAGKPSGALESFDEERVRTYAGELTSLLFLGRHAELQSYLARLAGNVADAGTEEEERKMNALSAAIALNEVIRKELGHKAADIGLGDRIGKLSRLQGREALSEWFGERLASFEQAFQSWLGERNSGSVEQAIRYVEEHYMKDCSLGAAAAHVHLSTNYFGNLFKRATGESFNAYVAGYRLKKAKLLLANTDMKIAEIAEAIGYMDSNYFATAFRQGEGMTPTEFRKSKNRH
ncbi:response regulator transcription factor [Paenibacillus arenilitoris]|uniref:Response regulator n=1 Tax=Paenibacillus arenilitoris TaxID=2772299 RepID=A0A927H409_9BACL|nr:response regulator [Paenibacillus arenilitoris]MBD2866973.1 response regulator [Paenibacillus arenilitoris]